MTTRRGMLAALALLAAGGCARRGPSSGARAASDRPWDRPVGPTVADRPSGLYRFERHRLDSADGRRHYRIELAIPLAPAPAGGHPTLYMLDGNAAMAELTQDDLQAMSAAVPPVLAAVGYDIDVRNDVVSRAYDYTPPGPGGAPVADERAGGRPGGGADVFLELIESRIKPLVRSRAAVDAGRQTLWGHSYGGLFALHVLFTRPDRFRNYVAGDPSAWWQDGLLVEEGGRFDPARARGKRVAVLVGTRPRPFPAGGPAQPGLRGQPDRRPALQAIVQRLGSAGAQASYEAFSQYGHGEMLRVSLERALEIASGR